MTMTYKVRRWRPLVRGFLIWRAKRSGGGITYSYSIRDRVVTLFLTPLAFDGGGGEG